jgi:hypothetical protein
VKLTNEFINIWTSEIPPPSAEPSRTRSMGLCLVGHHSVLSKVIVPTVQARTRLFVPVRALYTTRHSVAQWLLTMKPY